MFKEHGCNFKNTESMICKDMLSLIFLYRFSMFVGVVMVAESRDVLGGGGF